MRGRESRAVMLAAAYVLMLWRLGAFVESAKVSKGSIKHQTTAPLKGVGPTVGREGEPDFAGPIHNVTVPLGREAVLTCSVTDLGDYKVAWIRADDQTILTLHTRLVTHSSRYAVSSDGPGSWQLHIRPLKVEDRGCYMCQINTSTMKKQIGCVDVLVPPNILDQGTSGDAASLERGDVRLACRAAGRPPPRILWRREDGANILLRNEEGKLRKVDMYVGPELNFTRVERTQMGAYLCIASNDVPPSVSKRIMLSVNCVVVPLQPAQQKFFTPDITTFDTMQNVIEQSVLDNNWLPTVGSAAARAHSAPTITLTVLLLALPQLILLMPILFEKLSSPPELLNPSPASRRR